MNMSSPRSKNPRSNNPMFRRLVRRLLFANRGRLFVILLALSAGAAASAALLNLQVDAKRRINSEFRSFGANVVVLPKHYGPVADSESLPASLLEEIPTNENSIQVKKVGFLREVMKVDVLDEHLKPKLPAKTR